MRVKYFYRFLMIASLFLLSSAFLFAQRKPLPEPDLANIAYGTHERQVLDIWVADSTKATPLAIYIHGQMYVQPTCERGYLIEDMAEYIAFDWGR